MKLFAKHEIRYMFKRGNQRKEGYSVMTKIAKEKDVTLRQFGRRTLSKQPLFPSSEDDRFRWHFDYR